MTGLPRILAIVALTFLAVPRLLAQVAGDPLIQTGILSLPVGAAPSPLADGSGQIYGSYGLSSGSDHFNSQFVAGDLRAEEVLISAGYQQSSTTVTDDPSLTTTKTVNTAGILGFGADVGKSGALSATAAALYTRVAVDQPAGSGTATASFYDLAVGYSIDIRPHIRVGGNYSPKVSNSSGYSGVSAGQTLKVGHGDAYTLGIGLNDSRYSFAADYYESASNLSADSPYTQGYLLVGRYLLNDVRWFGDLVVLGQLNWFTSGDLKDQTTLAGAFWSTGRWVLGFQFAQQNESGSDSSTSYQYTFTFLRKLGPDRGPEREGEGPSEAEAREGR